MKKLLNVTDAFGTLFLVLGLFSLVTPLPLIFVPFILIGISTYGTVVLFIIFAIIYLFILLNNKNNSVIYKPAWIYTAIILHIVFAIVFYFFVPFAAQNHCC